MQHKKVGLPSGGLLKLFRVAKGHIELNSVSVKCFALITTKEAKMELILQ